MGQGKTAQADKPETEHTDSEKIPATGCGRERQRALVQLVQRDLGHPLTQFPIFSLPLKMNYF